ncbi:MAG: flagellar brake protein [Nitrospirota bacterium]|nr:flagellar brake protein [Nitrospirota bacterium]
MFDRIMTWFGGKPHSETRETGKIADIEQSRTLLKELKGTGCQLMLRFRGFDGSYTSSIVEVEKDSFLVDTFLPDSGNSLISKAQDIYVETILQGVTCSFLTHFQGNVVHADNFPAFRLELPLEVSRYQRRSAYRLKPAADNTISFLSPLEFTGPLFDISTGGIGFEYEATLGKLQVGAPVPNMIITLGDYTMATDGVVASNVITEVGTLSIPLRYRCGVKFAELPSAIVEDLERYIMKIQKVRQRMAHSG